MQFNTALCFALLGMAGIIKVAISARVALVPVFICFSIAVLTLFEYLIHVDFGLDTLFFQPNDTNMLFPGRMAPNTAVSFVAVSSITLIELYVKQPSKVVQSVSFSLLTIPLTLATFSVLGYLLGLEISLSEGHTARMSIPTSLCFLLLSIAFCYRENIAPLKGFIKPKFYYVVLCSLASVITWQAFILYEVNNASTYTQDQLRNLRAALANHFANTAQDLERMASRWEATNGTEKQNWTADALNYTIDQPWYQAIAWADKNSVIQWLVPEEANPNVIGISLNQQKDRADALEQARIKNTTVFFKPITLVNGKVGMLAVSPLFNQNGNFDGYIVGAFQIKQMFDQIVEQDYAQNFSVFLYQNDSLIYESNDSSLYFRGSVHADTLFLEDYRLSIRTKPEFMQSFRTSIPEFILVIGLIISTLIGIILHYWRENKLNIKELKKRQTQITESLLVQKAFMEKLGEAVVVTDSSGRIKEFTSAAQRLFGYSKDEAIGRNLKMLMPDNVAQQHDDFLRHFDTQQSQSVLGKTRQLEGIRKNGESFPIAIVVTSVELNEKLHFIGLIRDTTKMIAYQKDLEEERLKALQASQSKSEFLANMSHEIRTPMNGILGALQLLQLRVEDLKAKRLIDNALISSKSLLTIIDDILDLSKIEANMLHIENSDFSIRQLLEAVCSDLLPVASAKAITIKRQIDEDLHDRWVGDQIRIRQILINIVSNAVKFTNEGGVDIKIKEKQNQCESVLQIIVKDSGIGMSPEAVKSIFERFTQADSSTTRQYGGTGLGMAITYNLVELMEGEIKVASKLNAGTQFVVNLPLQHAKNMDEQSKNETLSIPKLNGKSILIVEDNDINQTILGSMLSETHASVYIADNGKIGVEKARQFNCDLVLMDIHMPVMDGFEACRKIKNEYPDKPVIALTADLISDNVEAYEAAGFNSHLGKPIVIEELYSLLHRYLLTSSEYTSVVK
uniref:ATP-binding protein n=1 Tax=Ningiella ruwaisensis TaxID=2364274 RepID=UPI00109FADA2|nr:ATP-binding protein [Ningiella ruwaisensis]